MKADALPYGAFVETGKGNERRLHFFVEGIHCSGCIKRIEKTLSDFPKLETGRVNFSTQRLTMAWRDPAFDPGTAAAAVEKLGFRLVPARAVSGKDEHAKRDKKLLLAMAVAGFGAANIMLLSISIWSGETSMGENTRTLFHWISALIALPVIAYSGRPFFSSALSALKGKRLNMDVPISLAVLLAAGLSLYETIIGGRHAYFDASVMLLFFLLVGRYLDGLARSKARSVGEQFLALQGIFAHVETSGGKLETIPADAVRKGMTLLVRPGEKFPADGVVANGEGDVDTSLITGETVPRALGIGDKVFAGTINLTGALRLTVTAVGEGTLLSEITRLMETAEQQKSKYVRWADRAAAIYAPAVHLAGAATFLGWWLLGSLAWQDALTIAISVLIITCPCALGIAVPAVQVVAIGALLKKGIIVKSGDALEKLSAIKAIVFDKTGTLTTGHLTLANGGQLAKKDLHLAAALAKASRHPLSQALARSAPDVKAPANVKELPGKGLEAKIGGQTARLGSAAFCGAKATETGAPEIWLKVGSEAPVRFLFKDTMRDDAAATIAALKEDGYAVSLLSGDREGAVGKVAAALSLDHWRGAAKPDEKIAFLKEERAAYGAVMMVGDGLNDTPSLAFADVSASPATATDLSQTAADMVFQGDKLSPVAAAIATAKKSRHLVAQNFGLAVLYNLVAIPFAVMGYATPLVAAIAMSSSSILVTLNALRAGRP